MLTKQQSTVCSTILTARRRKWIRNDSANPLTNPAKVPKRCNACGLLQAPQAHCKTLTVPTSVPRQSKETPSGTPQGYNLQTRRLTPHTLTTSVKHRSKEMLRGTPPRHRPQTGYLTPHERCETLEPQTGRFDACGHGKHTGHPTQLEPATRILHKYCKQPTAKHTEAKERSLRSNGPPI